MTHKRYELGLYLGRFQPLHIGHTSIIDQMLDECERIVIAVGSATSSGTERNPLSFQTRASYIESVYFDKLNRIKIVPIYDRETYSDDSSWGVYVLNNLNSCYDLTPDVIYEGDDSANTNWWDDCNIPVVRVSRKVTAISGTELRKAIKSNRTNFALTYLPKPLHRYYESIRKEIQNGTTN